MTSYDASSIKVLEGLEAVRLRPGMYLGGKDGADQKAEALSGLFFHGIGSQVRTQAPTRIELDGSHCVYSDGTASRGAFRCWSRSAETWKSRVLVPRGIGG